MAVVTYPANEIQVLELSEAIRKRPHMYVGTEDVPTKLVQEVLCRALASACQNETTELDIVLGPEGRFEVSDNGPGWSVLPNKKGISQAEIIMTMLYACKDEKDEKRKGLCNNGIVTANALSEKTTLTTWTDSYEWVQTYTKGKPDGPIRRTGWVNRQGSHLAFKLDPTVIKDLTFNVLMLEEYLRKQAPKGLRWTTLSSAYLR